MNKILTYFFSFLMLFLVWYYLIHFVDYNRDFPKFNRPVIEENTFAKYERDYGEFVNNPYFNRGENKSESKLPYIFINQPISIYYLSPSTKYPTKIKNTIKNYPKFIINVLYNIQENVYEVETNDSN